MTKTTVAVVYDRRIIHKQQPRTTLKAANFARLLAEAKSSLDEIRSLRVLPRAMAGELAEAVKEPAASYGQKTGPTKDAPPEKTKAGEVFKRFCAFADDRRILPDGGLRPGTYATTEKDAGNVKTGRQAVARYALPDPRPASHRFTIELRENTIGNLRQLFAR